MNFKNLDKKTVIYIGIGGGIVLFLILILIMLKLFTGSTISTKNYEKKLKAAAISYYDKFPKKLPATSGSRISISINELEKSNLIKEQNKLLSKGTSCTGEVNISNNNGFYLYQPVISCTDKYETTLLYNKIIDENLVTSSNGLYKMNDEYIFRGENLNNFVSFANMKWRILRIKNDNSIRLLLSQKIPTASWDDRYNNDKKSNTGKNDFNISRIKDTLNAYYNNNTFSNQDKAYIIPQELCIGARNKNSIMNDGSLECSKKTEAMPLGLMQLSEYVVSSLEPTCTSPFQDQCTNYNHLTDLSAFWTITPNSENTYSAFYIDQIAYSAYTSQYKIPRIAINISADTLYTKGDGSEENPYIIK